VIINTFTQRVLYSVLLLLFLQLLGKLRFVKAISDYSQFFQLQDALVLLCASFSAPRVQHLMRYSLSVDNPALADFDKLLRAAISHLTNCDLTDEQWLQESLLIKME